MGKGGTKFEGEAIGSRGKRFKSYTLKDRKKDLEDFQKTGVHPEIEAIRQKRTEEALAALPDPETGRPRTYLEFAINKDVVGEPMATCNRSSSVRSVWSDRPPSRQCNCGKCVLTMWRRMYSAKGCAGGEIHFSCKSRSHRAIPCISAVGKVVFKGSQGFTPL